MVYAYVYRDAFVLNVSFRFEFSFSHRIMAKVLGSKFAISRTNTYSSCSHSNALGIASEIVKEFWRH